MEDAIIVSQLEIQAHVGVPAAERGTAQRLTISLRLIPTRSLSGLGDDLANTVDYAEVCEVVRAEAAARPCHLVETLAEEIALLLLARFPVSAVEIELRKFILPDAGYVAVHVRREREP